METMRKCAALTAAYRGSTKIELIDTLVAIEALEEWYENLFKVADMISASLFQQECDQIETWISTQPGGASRAKLLNRFGNLIKFGVNEIDNRINYLVDSGRITEDDLHAHVRKSQAEAEAKTTKGVTPPGSPDTDNHGAVRRENRA